jgi:hypothetical protein
MEMGLLPGKAWAYEPTETAASAANAIHCFMNKLLKSDAIVKPHDCPKIAANTYRLTLDCP